MKSAIDFTKNNGLVPVIIQDYLNGDVYMLGYMNQMAVTETLEKGIVFFWSRSKGRLWMKGEESGNRLQVIDFFIDCDHDTILIKVKLLGTNVCHTGRKTCFTKIEKGQT